MNYDDLRDLHYRNVDKCSLSENDLNWILENTGAPELLLCNPFSADDNYRGRIKKPFFFGCFHVLSLSNYERLAMIAHSVNNIHKNTIFFTGYRGCGKTTFANYLADVVHGDWFVEMINANEYHDNYKKNSEYGRIYTKRFDEMLKLFNSLFPELVPDGYDQAENDDKLRFVQHVVNDLNENLRATGTIFNVEIDVDNERGNPILSSLRKEILNTINVVMNSDIRDFVFQVIKNIESATTRICESNFVQNYDLVFENKSIKRHRFFKSLRNANDANNNTAIKNLKNLESTRSGDNLLTDNRIKIINSFNRVFELCKRISKGTTYSSLSASIENELNNMSTVELLGVLMIINIAILEVKQSRQKIIYIFDNLDAVNDLDYVTDFIKQYNTFAKTFSSVLQNVDKNGTINPIDFREDFCCIFFMRDTTARVLNDHHLGNLDMHSFTFDVSQDLEKGKIIEKRYKYLKEKTDIILSKNNNIRLSRLFSIISNVINILEDENIKINIAQMFNNDYVRLVKCLTKICADNVDQVAESYRIICIAKGQYDKINDDAAVKNYKNIPPEVRKQFSYGARGIIYRLVFELFKSEGFFQKLDVYGISNNSRGYTPSRMILSYLYKKMPLHHSTFLQNDNDEFVTFAELRRNFNGVFSPKRNTPEEKIQKQTDEMLATVLWNLYEMKSTSIWAHLVSFLSLNSIKNGNENEIGKLPDDITKEDVLREIKSDSPAKIAITCAGRTYVEFISSHYEFFDMKSFSTHKTALFLSSNIKELEEHTKKAFIIKTVKIIDDNLNIILNSSVSKNTLTELIKDIKYSFESMILSNYIYVLINQYKISQIENNIMRRLHIDSLEDAVFSFKHARKGYVYWHFERVIHRAIKYLDNYRLFLINVYANNLETIEEYNIRLLCLIELYYNMLDRKSYSKESKELLRVAKANKIKIVDGGYSDTKLSINDGYHLKD